MHNDLADYWMQYILDFDKKKNSIHISRSVEKSIDWVVDYVNQSQNLKIEVLVTNTFGLVGNILTGNAWGTSSLM
ncbi:unnamed protein product [Cunninghamella blakesleeana]